MMQCNKGLCEDLALILNTQPHREIISQKLYWGKAQGICLSGKVIGHYYCEKANGILGYKR